MSQTQAYNSCPFCGGEHITVFRRPDTGATIARCDECSATTLSPARENAFGALCSERDYQADKWGEKPHEIDAFALYIAEYTAQLTHVCGTSGDNIAKLDAVRKVGALALAAMEQHGAPRRAGF